MAPAPAFASIRSQTSARPARAPAHAAPAPTVPSFTPSLAHRVSAPCACGGACPRCQSPAAPFSRIALGPANDASEREAERAAHQLTRPAARRGTGIPPVGLSSPRLRFSPAPAPAAPEFLPASSFVDQVLDSPGDSLSPAERSHLEPRLGRNLDGVRIHADAQAAESARALDAQAYTVGRHIVFGAGHYTPDTAPGRHLLAHELAHVAQYELSAGAESATLRRRPVTEADLPSVAQYEWTGTQQRKSASNRLNQAYVSLSYNAATGDFQCTFKLRWRFPETWAEPNRASYIEDFVRVVKATWENKFPLAKYDGGKLTTDRAKVLLAFDSVRAPDIKASGDEVDYVNWLLSPAGAATKERWTVNVHTSMQFRDNVDAPNVHLDPGANVAQSKGGNGSAYTDRSINNFGPGGQIQNPPYQHYFDQGITPSQGRPPKGGYVQTTSAHEFGHMIGLADEYVLSKEDYGKIVKAKGQTAGDTALRQRRTDSSRIENIGDQVTKDAYAPFADFLHTITAEDWRVQ